MKNQKEYNVNKIIVGDSIFYFLGNDYIVVSDTIISCRRKNLTNYKMDKEDFKQFKMKLDYISDNNLTINF